MGPTKRLLIVDDEAVVGQLLLAYLSNDYLVITADSAQSALIHCKVENFDVLLIDDSMPKGNGITVIPEIRKRRPKLVIVMMTGGTLTKEEALKAGANAVISKPFSDRFLVEKQLIINLLNP